MNQPFNCPFASRAAALFVIDFCEVIACKRMNGAVIPAGDIEVTNYGRFQSNLKKDVSSINKRGYIHNALGLCGKTGIIIGLFLDIAGYL